MASLSDLAKKVRNTTRRNSQAFLRTEENDGSSPASIEYGIVNMGRFMNASFSSETVSSSADQDGRESAQLFDITVSLALMQTSNVELSLLSELAMPDPGDLGRYINGHTLYFSGDNQVTTSDVSNALDTSTGEIAFGTGSDELDDPDGLLFKNVLLKPSPDIDLAGDESSIGIEFTGTVETEELNDLDTTQTLNISPQ